MAVDLPGEIIDAAGKGGARLGEADQGERLALRRLRRQARAATRRPLRRARPARPATRAARCRSITLGIGVDDRARPFLPLGPQLRAVGEREAGAGRPRADRPVPPPSSAGSGQTGSAPPGRRWRRSAAARRLVLRPDQPRRLGEPRPDRDAAGLGAAFAREIRLAQHRIFGDQAVMLERKDVGRDQPVGEGEPAPAIGFLDSPTRSGRNRASGRRARAACRHEP